MMQMSPTRISRPAIVAGVVLMLLLGACSASGSDAGGDPAAKPYVDSWSAFFVKGDGSDFRFTPSQAECVVPKLVAVMDPDRLEAKGIRPRDFSEGSKTDVFAKLNLSEGEGMEMVDAFGSCGILLRENFVRGVASSSSAPAADVKRCLERELDDDTLTAYYVAGFTEGSKAVTDDSAAPVRGVLKAVETCTGSDRPGG